MSVSKYREFADFLRNVGKDPSRLVFEDELTGIHNRRFLLSYLEQKVDWRGGADFPISLLIVDLDEFKLVNDNHGHDVGDQVLTWLAGLLSNVAGESGYPIRYGGDEFVLLLRETDREEARQTSYALLQQTRDNPFMYGEECKSLPVTISIGVATAPHDAASSTQLFQAADTALYHAKRSGKNQVATAWEIEVEDVFERTALQKLAATGLVGRSDNLAAVSEALEKLGQGESTFLFVEGAPGMGKTSFLEAIDDHLGKDRHFRVVRASGDQQESYRPYYLTTRILLALLPEVEDSGVEALASLTKAERGYLSHVLPQLAEKGPQAAEAMPEAAKSQVESERLTREGIFSTLVHFIPRAADWKPIVLLLDDLQFADEASLFLLRILVKREEFPVFVCGAALESLEVSAREEAPPLERFLSDYEHDHEIRIMKLHPLSRQDIADHLQSVFPGLEAHAGFENELAEITQGNPLFVGEIIRKLIAEQMIIYTGHEWRLLQLDRDYLPRSLEEIVLQKIDALDVEGRQILEQATALGEDVPLSILTGSTDLEELKVLEFLDRAEALGLVRLGFQVNDEVMRFLGKRVLQISYGMIDEERRQELHERVGTYQENLYKKRLLPSASLLAYHFKRSANQEKARRYEQMQIAYQQSVFNAGEAVAYTGEPIAREPDIGDPLEPDLLGLIPDVIRTLLTAARNLQLYPQESDAIERSRREVGEALGSVLKEADRLNFSLHERTLWVNGEEIDQSEFKTLASSFVDVLVSADLRTLSFSKGVTDGELGKLLECLANLRSVQIEPGFWIRFAVDQGFEHIDLRQVKYAAVRDLTRDTASPEADPSLKDEDLSDEDLDEIPGIMRAILGAAKSVRLYPVGSEPVRVAVEDAHASLQSILSRRKTLSLAAKGEFLLANGRKIRAGEHDALATSFVETLTSLGLSSLSFSSGVSKSEIETFLAALRNLPTLGTEPEFWVNFVAENPLDHLTFNELDYVVAMGRFVSGEAVEEEDDTVELLLNGGGEGVFLAGGAIPSADGEGSASGMIEGREYCGALPEWAADVPFVADQDEVAPDVPDVPDVADVADVPDVHADSLSRFGKDLLVQGEETALAQLLRRLFEDYSSQRPDTRRALLASCGALMDELILALQSKFATLATDSLLESLSVEEDEEIVAELAGLLHRMGETAVQFSDYRAASRIYEALAGRKQELECADEPELKKTVAHLDRHISPAVQELLIEDMRSGESSRQEKAGQVLGSLGSQGISILIEVIKQEKDLRVRQLVASILAGQGPQAAKEIKRALALEVTTEQRFHILEVIDTVTDDLRDELTYCLGDVNPKIRRAAFRLAERLNDDDLIEILIPFVRDEEPNVAKGTIRSLANLRSTMAANAVVSILETTKEPELAVACCQALGQIGGPGAVESLEKVLGQKNFLIMGRRWDGQVRATAVLALRQIDHPRAASLLQELVNDRDPVIRQLATSDSPDAA